MQPSQPNTKERRIMPNDELSALLNRAARKAMQESGYVINRVPGRGPSNTWQLESAGKNQTASVRTTKNRWFAFQPLEEGAKWKTLDEVDLVVVSAVDDHHEPRNIQVYFFDSSEVRECFDLARRARVKAGKQVTDNFGMWVSLNLDDRDLPDSVGSGLADKHPPVAAFSVDSLREEADGSLVSAQAAEPLETEGPPTIANVLSGARSAIAGIAGVPNDAVKLELRIEL